jgi:hypothetical protein
MAKTSRKATRKRGTKPKHYDKPLSLYGMSLLGAIDAIVPKKPNASNKATKKR